MEAHCSALPTFKLEEECGTRGDLGQVCVWEFSVMERLVSGDACCVAMVKLSF